MEQALVYHLKIPLYLVDLTASVPSLKADNIIITLAIV